MPTRISGTISASSGVWRPTIPPRSSTGRPVTSDSVVIGTAMAPNATGAVLATSATAAALMGRKPRAINITAVIATGVPKPASASSSAPKQKAMITAWTRWSSEIAPNDRLSTLKCPVSTVMLYTQIAVTTIHMIGNSPKTAPSEAERRPWSTGMS